MKYILIVNQRSKMRYPRHYLSLIKAAEGSGTELRIVLTRSGEDLAGKVDEAIRDAYDFILIFGGDGSLHSAVQAFGRCLGARSVLVALPFGTGNDFYRGLNGKANRSDLEWIFRSPKISRISLGKVKWDGGMRFFLNSLSIGITTDILSHYESSWSRNYLSSTLNRIFRYRPIIVDNEEILLIMVCKGPYTGAGMRLHPESSHDRVKYLEVPKVSLITILKNLPNIYSSGITGVPSVRSSDFSPKMLEIAHPEPRIEADGEILTVGPRICLEVIPNAIRVAYFTSD